MITLFAWLCKRGLRLSSTTTSSADVCGATADNALTPGTTLCQCSRQPGGRQTQASLADEALLSQQMGVRCADNALAGNGAGGCGEKIQRALLLTQWSLEYKQEPSACADSLHLLAASLPMYVGTRRTENDT